MQRGFQERGFQERGYRARLASLLSRASQARPVDWLRRRRAERRSVGDARLDPGRAGFLAMAVVAALVAAGTGCWVLASRPHRIPVPASANSMIEPRPSSASSDGSPVTAVRPPAASVTVSAVPSSAGATLLVVDVVGKVRRPGLYRVPPGSRVDDAVAAAGGVLPGVDPATVNLARKLTDGEQLVIGLPIGAATPATPVASASGGPGAAAQPVDLNSATMGQLDGLPGVGPVLAQRIVDWRTQHGRFDSVDQLRKVSGIGDAKYQTLKSLVTVG